jgi:hypothetical protein
MSFAEDSRDFVRLARKNHSKQVVSCIRLFSKGGVIIADKKKVFNLQRVSVEPNHKHKQQTLQ